MFSNIGKEILQQLAGSNSFISGEDLSKICNVSVNTIRKEIELLNEYLKEKGCVIEAKIAAGYYLAITDAEVASPLLTLALKEFKQFRYMNYAEFSTAYLIVMKLLVSVHYVSLDSLINSFYCSKSTMLRTFDQIRLILEPFHLELKAKRNYGLYIDGNEWCKRICLIYIHKVFAHENKPLINNGLFSAMFLNQSDYPQIIREYIMRYFNEHTAITIPNIHVIKLTQYILLAKTRAQYSAEIQFSEDQKQRLEQMPTYRAAQDIYLSLPAYFQEDVQEVDILSLSALIACCMTLRSPEQIPSDQLSLIQDEVHEMIAFLEKYYDVSYCFDEQFYQSFWCYLYCLKLKKEFNFSTDAEKLTNSTKIGLWTADICSLFALFYKVKHDVYLKEEDLVDAYYIFNLSIHKNNVYFNRMKLAIVSRYGRYYSANIADRLLYRFGRYMERIDILEYTEVTNERLENYDSVITDINMNLLPQTYHGSYVECSHQWTNSEFDNLSFLQQNYNQRAQRLFQKENFHKTTFSTQTDVYEAIYALHQHECGKKEQFIRDLEMRNSFISYEKAKNIILITNLALRFQQPIFEVFVNEKPIVWNTGKARVYIFYQHGDGSKENVQIVSYLLKQFIHQSEMFINTLYEQSYEEVFSIFHII